MGGSRDIAARRQSQAHNGRDSTARDCILNATANTEFYMMQVSISNFTISPLDVCFQTLDPLNSSSLDNFDEKIVNNCISNLYPCKACNINITIVSNQIYLQFGARKYI